MRRILAASIVFAGACTDIPFEPPNTRIVTAEFDPQAGVIPLPNDLVFLRDPNSFCVTPTSTSMAPADPPACAQAELIALFNGAFPSDQEVPVTIDFVQTNLNDGTQTFVAPDLDLSTINSSTVIVLAMTSAAQGTVAFQPVTAADYVKLDDHGTLTIHNVGDAPWPPGQYAVFVRGGENGVKTVDGTPISPSPTFYFIAQGKDMTDPRNLGLLRAETGSFEAAAALGAQLNQLIALYSPLFPFVDMHFPHEQLAILTTFKIGPTVTNVTIDAARGIVPLPIDLLRDPNTGHITARAACTFAGSSLDASGSCPAPAAAGFEALDGFSTTGTMIGQTSDLIRAATVTPQTVLLFDLTDPNNPVQVDPTTLVFEPCELTSACGSPTALAPAVALQPAGATSGDPTSVFRSRPLKDNTDYAVVMTTGILDKSGHALGPGTVASILRFQNPISIGGRSQLTGIDDTTAAALEKMRLQLRPVFATVAAAGISQSQVAIAYTFHTQSILTPAVQLAALPYTLPATTAVPIASTFNALTPAAAFRKYGVDPNVVPSDDIDEIIEVDITTLDALDPITGAFLRDPTQGTPEQIHVLIATPRATNPAVPACSGPLAPFGHCAPMMIFHHGLGSGRAAMLAVADVFAEAGMVTVAIDSAKHGDRAFCTSGTTGAASGCAGGATCTSSLPPGAQGDAQPPGTCGAAGFAKHPVSATCTGACAAAATDGIPFVSGNYVVSANLFRTRDTFRQDFIDQSQLVRAIAFAPSGAPPTGNPVFDHMVTRGLIIDPATVYYSGQSLGAILGMGDVATNPRISKAAFNVGGGTIVDIFSNSPAFASQVDALLAGLGIDRGTEAYLRFLIVAKMVLDPADPINFAGHITGRTLPNLLADPSGGVRQAPKAALFQVANCDQVVPNPFSFLAASNIPVGPLPTDASFFAPGGRGTFQLFVDTPFDPATFGTCTSGVVEHGFLTDWITPSLTVTAQRDIADFVMLGINPLRVESP